MWWLEEDAGAAFLSATQAIVERQEKLLIFLDRQETRDQKKKKSVRTFASRTGNEGLSSKRVAKNPSCYCRCEIQLDLSRIVHLRQWQSRGRRKSLCPGGSLPACRISTWAALRRRSKASRAQQGECWTHSSWSLLTLWGQTTTLEKFCQRCIPKCTKSQDKSLRIGFQCCQSLLKYRCWRF